MTFDVVAGAPPDAARWPSTSGRRIRSLGGGQIREFHSAVGSSAATRRRYSLAKRLLPKQTVNFRRRSRSSSLAQKKRERTVRIRLRCFREIHGEFGESP